MKLPHILIHSPRIARLWGHGGWTLGFWTFASTRRVGLRFMRHERRHVVHWLVGTVAGAVIVIALHVLFGISLWFLLASPLGFLIPYLLCLALVGYHRNPFERDAERYADGGT